MIERLRALSRPLRYATYVAGVLLVLMIAAGVGATAAMVVGGQLGRFGTDSGQNGTFEGSKLETTGPDSALEGTGIEPSKGSTTPIDAADKASFVHQADQENSRGDYTYISEPSINGDANAIVIVSISPTSDRESTGAASYGHNIGVWYEPVARRWAIFNQDRAPVPAGSAFEVVVPQASAGFVHDAGLLNTAGNYTYIDNRLTNGKPDIELAVTQNWNPGGRRGVYNNHPVDTLYDPKVKKWAIYNLDGAPIPEGASFNVAVSAGASDSVR
ncbi:hypothetical protein BH18ACT11_BH18ACT11_18200 [soil metagenome]